MTSKRSVQHRLKPKVVQVINTPLGKIPFYSGSDGKGLTADELTKIVRDHHKKYAT